jgi:hypothetical protein
LEPRAEFWDERIRRHVDECQLCRETIATLELMRVRLRGLASARAEAPEALVAKLRAVGASSDAEATDPAVAGSPVEAGDSASTPRGLHFWMRRWSVPVAALVVGVLLGITLAPRLIPRAFAPLVGEVPATVEDYIHDVTHDHFLLEKLGRPLELECSDAAEASLWLSQGLPFSVTLRPAPTGWELLGVRIWHTVGRLSALAEYGDAEGRRLVLFAVPEANINFSYARMRSAEPDTLFAGSGWGSHALAWCSDGLAWTAVAKLSSQQLRAWLQRYREPS